MRKDFPIFAQQVNGRDVAFLDSAASAQKPRQVIDSMSNVLQTHYANVHRGIYHFGAKTSAAFERVRGLVAQFINAASEREIIFTRNATEAINLVAESWGTTHLKPGDEIILTELEHHANIVPWVRLAQKQGAVIRVVPILHDGSLDEQAFQSLLNDRTRLVCVTQMSNVLGTVVDVKSIVDQAHKAGAKVLVDGSQAIVHLGADMQDLGCDFYVFTGHKLYGPTGVGVLYGRYDVLETMPPYQGGGEMIENVSFDQITYKEPPHRFEAGTPAIVEVIGLGAAIDYLKTIDLDSARKNEARLLSLAEEKLSAIDGVEIYSRAKNRASILSFNVAGVHPHDVAMVLDQVGVAIRAGHHCAQPLMKVLGVSATARASIALYNSDQDVDQLEEGLRKVKKLFG